MSVEDQWRKRLLIAQLMHPPSRMEGKPTIRFRAWQQPPRQSIWDFAKQTARAFVFFVCMIFLLHCWVDFIFYITH